jgi:hypothetical protein
VLCVIKNKLLLVGVEVGPKIIIKKGYSPVCKKSKKYEKLFLVIKRKVKKVKQNMCNFVWI